jgi:hypothetical protein
LLSFIRNATLEDGIETAKSVAFRPAKLFKVNPEFVLVVVPVVPVVVLVLLVIVGL